jgi:hypothetical protein
MPWKESGYSALDSSYERPCISVVVLVKVLASTGAPTKAARVACGYS